MERSDLPDFFRSIELLCKTFGRPWSEELGEAYSLALSDQPIEVVIAKCRAALLGERMPLPKDLVGNGNADELEACAAWEETRPCFASHRQPSDPIAREVVHLLGGSARIGAKDSEEVGTWVRKDFIRLYQEQSKKERRDLSRRALARGSSGSLGDSVRELMPGLNQQQS